jgi:sugar-specific transcriptional regulator TrmB
MTSNAEAVEALTELGLTEYEARCFVALTQLSDGTAKEISQVADVPQSRVYDVTDQLHHRGLVDVQESEPRTYFALPVEQALERLQREYDDAVETANRRLQALDSRETNGDGVWGIADKQDVIVRVKMHVDDATAEVYLLVGDEELLEPEVLDALDEASEDVDVFAEVPSESARDRLHDAVSGANVAITDLPLESMTVDGREPGRLLMVDRETILMSALREGLVPDDTEETGLWGSEVGHGLVVWLRPLLESRLDRLDFASAGST